jgi:uncharacterized protein (TIGR03083 family)
MTDFDEARGALSAAAERTAQLVEAIDDMELRVPNSEWTIGETTAHLIFALRGFSASASSAFDEWLAVADQLPTTVPAPARVAAVNRLFIPAEPTRTPAEAAKAIKEGAEAFVLAAAGLPPEQAMPTPWYGETETLTIGQATCLLLGEQIIHGYDMAQAAKRTWPIAQSDALLMFEAAKAMMPKLANRETLGTTRATFEIHLGGKEIFVVRCADGAIHVEPPTGQRVDCHLVTDPAAFLLVGYGRITHWRAIARGKMFVWGRRPWLAFRFPSFLHHP